MQTVQKQALPVVINDQGDPIALVYFSQQRERIVYILQKADEEQIISLLTTDTNKQARDTQSEH